MNNKKRHSIYVHARMNYLIDQGLTDPVEIRNLISNPKPSLGFISNILLKRTRMASKPR